MSEEREKEIEREQD